MLSVAVHLLPAICWLGCLVAENGPVAPKDEMLYSEVMLWQICNLCQDFHQDVSCIHFFLYTLVDVP